jgi:hypothetical protein
MSARIEEAFQRLEAASRWSKWLIVDAAVVATAAAIFATFSTKAAAALGGGAGLLVVVALAVRDRRRELVGRLAVDPDAYVIPDVARYGARAAAPAQVASLSDWLREAVATCGEGNTWYAEDRVLAFRTEIATLASELGAPGILVSPHSAVECTRLLTRTVESPLYNPQLPPENLRAAIFRIRAGISSPHGSRV